MPGIKLCQIQNKCKVQVTCAVVLIGSGKEINALLGWQIDYKKSQEGRWKHQIADLHNVYLIDSSNLRSKWIPLSNQTTIAGCAHHPNSLNFILCTHLSGFSSMLLTSIIHLCQNHSDHVHHPSSHIEASSQCMHTTLKHTLAGTHSATRS